MSLKFIRGSNLEGFNMPSMPRINKKCKKIAYDILGEPPALKSYKTKRQKKLDREILESEFLIDNRYRRY